MSKTLPSGVTRSAAPYFFSISKAAKHLKIRRETVRLAIESGDLKTRYLPGRVRPVLTQPDLDRWIASLEPANVPLSCTDPSSNSLTNIDAS